MLLVRGFCFWLTLHHYALKIVQLSLDLYINIIKIEELGTFFSFLFDDGLQKTLILDT